MALAAATAAACLWLNQGPSAARFDALAETARTPGHAALQAWMPLAFLYRRSADEELYFAIARAMRGLPYDRDVLVAKRGEAPAAFARMPPADGHWHPPYAEVPIEYPAVVLPLLLLPALLAGSFAAFAGLFGGLMGALMVGSAAIAIATAASASAPERAARGWLATALFLAQGGLLIQRVDAAVALALAFALWAATERRPGWMGLGMGLAGAAKILPVLALLPMMAADRDAWRAPRAIAQLAAGVTLGLAAGFVPMAVASPTGLGEFLAYHAARGLHVESTYGAILSVLDLAAGTPRPATLAFGSYNLAGPVAAFFASASLPLLLVAIATVTAWTARDAGAPRTRRAERIARAGLAGLLCIWLFGKVFSPQYLTWGIPWVLATPSRRAAATLGLAMALSQAYLRGFYDYVVEMRPLGVATLAARLAVLVALAVLVLRRAPPEDTPRAHAPA